MVVKLRIFGPWLFDLGRADGVMSCPKDTCVNLYQDYHQKVSTFFRTTHGKLLRKIRKNACGKAVKPIKTGTCVSQPACGTRIRKIGLSTVFTRVCLSQGVV